jgi:threonine dehydrogenase-like Zn-dependent dehydrogenase
LTSSLAYSGIDAEVKRYPCRGFERKVKGANLNETPDWMVMPVKRIILFSAGIFAVAIVARRLVVTRVPSVRELDGPRWRTATILRSENEMAPQGVMPQPILMLGDLVIEARSTRMDGLYNKVKNSLRLETDRSTAAREAVMAARKGGSVFILGVFGGLVDKGLTVRSAQQHGHRYIPMLLERMAVGEISTSYLATHVMPLDDAPAGYAMFKAKEDGCVRAVFHP